MEAETSRVGGSCGWDKVSECKLHIVGVQVCVFVTTLTLPNTFSKAGFVFC